VQVVAMADLPVRELGWPAVAFLCAVAGCAITAALLLASGASAVASVSALGIAIAAATAFIAWLQWRTAEVQAGTAKEQSATAKEQAATAKEQARVAQQQAHTSHTALKLSMFERRYEMYKTSEDLLELVGGCKLTVDDNQHFFRTVAPARFLFPEHVHQYLVDHVHREIIMPYVMLTATIDTDGPDRAHAMRRRVELLMSLSDEYDKLAEVFRPYLQIE
jgi:hypothetical protein